MESTAVVKSELPPAPLVVGPPPVALLVGREELTTIWRIAGYVLAAEGMVPSNIKTKAQAAAIMLAGLELGLRPMTALRHVFIVNGKTDIETRAMVGIIKNRDPRIEFEWPEYTRDAVTCIITRPNQKPVTVRYTTQDAKASGQWEGKMGIWPKYTLDMNYAAATKRACRIACPDLINAIESNMVPVGAITARVIDEPDFDETVGAELAREIAAEVAADGPLSPEVEMPDPKIVQQQILADIKRARAEWDTADFGRWTLTIRADFPAAFTAEGKPRFPELDADTLGALAARVRADVGAVPEAEQGVLA